jgi:pyruvate/2-oxoglutarate dehydrogenase complex dihydrolipoamide acyltransferase (E2) component
MILERRDGAGARVIPYPAYQRMAAAAYRSIHDTPMIHGLIEVDVTHARALLREHHARTGESLSFTAFLAACVARAVDEHKAVQAFRQGRRRLVVFDDVDVCARIERDVDGEKYVIPCILRAANRKSVRSLHDEIRAAQAADARPALNRFRWVPTALHGPMTRAFAALAARRPRLWKETMGTVGITSVGMFGHGAGWGIPTASPTALMVTVGGIAEKPTVVDGRIAVRELLCLTISADHSLVDGAPAARFTQRVKELIEAGHGLEDLSRARPTRPGAEPTPDRGHRRCG